MGQDEPREKTVKHFVLELFSGPVSRFYAPLLDAFSICLRYVISYSFGREIQNDHCRNCVGFINTV